MLTAQDLSGSGANGECSLERGMGRGLHLNGYVEAIMHAGAWLPWSSYSCQYALTHRFWKEAPNSHWFFRVSCGGIMLGGVCHWRRTTSFRGPQGISHNRDLLTQFTYRLNPPSIYPMDPANLRSKMPHHNKPYLLSMPDVSSCHHYQNILQLQHM